VSGQDTLSAVNSGKPLGGRVSPRSPLGSSQRTSRSPSYGGLGLLPLLKSHTPAVGFRT